MKIKVGIIGLGFVGSIHYKLLSEIEDFEITAVCDLIEEKLMLASEGVRRYTKADDLIADSNVECVVVASNNNTHKDMVCKAAKSGKDIICEKPVAMNMQELDEMIRAVEANRVHFTVHQQRRYDKDFRSVKKVYDKGLIGEIYTIRSALYGYNGNMHDWHVYKSEGGGMMYDWGVHLIDQILWMINSKLKTVYADIRNIINEEVDDYFKIILHFENKVTVEIELGTYFLSDADNWYTRHWFVGGNKGSMYADGFEPEGKIVKTTKLLTNVDRAKPLGAEGPTRSFGTPEQGLLVTEDIPKINTEYKNYFENYAKALKGEEEFIVKIPEVKRVLAVMEAAWKSAESNRVIDFE